MQQRARRLAMFFGGSFLAGAGLFAAACGTDNGTTPVPTTDGGGRDTGGGGRETGTTDDDSSTPVGDGGADCANIPKPQSSDGPFCFSVADASADGGTMSKNCSAADEEICCSGGRLPADAGFEPSRCEKGYNETTACVGFVSEVKQWHCMEAAHCPGNGDVCCATASD